MLVIEGRGPAQGYRASGRGGRLVATPASGRVCASCKPDGEGRVSAALAGEGAEGFPKAQATIAGGWVGSLNVNVHCTSWRL